MFIQNNQSRSAVRNAVANRYTVVCCAKLITGTNFRRGFLARLDAQDFCIEQARKLALCLTCTIR